MQSTILIALFAIILMILCFTSTDAIPTRSTPLSAKTRPSRPSTSHVSTHSSRATRTNGSSKPTSSRTTHSPHSNSSKSTSRPTTRSRVGKQRRSNVQAKTKLNREKRLSTWEWA